MNSGACTLHLEKLVSQKRPSDLSGLTCKMKLKNTDQNTGLSLVSKPTTIINTILI